MNFLVMMLPAVITHYDKQAASPQAKHRKSQPLAMPL
jgi:hypothetical protein